MSAAAARGKVLPVFIHDEVTPDIRRIGAAGSWWRNRSLAALNTSLGGALLLRCGAAEAELRALILATGATAVFWNRLYDAPSISRDSAIKASLTSQGVPVRSFNASLLNEPWEVKTGASEPYKVFTPYWRALTRDLPAPVSAPAFQSAVSRPKKDELNTWALEDREPNWTGSWGDIWTPGEAGARARLAIFIEEGANGYAVNRDRPDRAGVSRLSPHLHWGEISPRQVMSSVHDAVARGDIGDHDGEAFSRELYWREFSYHLLYHFPSLTTRNWRPQFDAYPWRKAPRDLDAWKRRRTGYPFVDAGMRELWATGYMQNRVRMVAASFLVKHLQIDWRVGEAWFWDTLVDADLANNSASWQWVAGSCAPRSLATTRSPLCGHAE
jgi:deoxyribodipyrimidine photo-lyase